MKLFIVHSHFRAGGVRRIIELATPQLVARLRPRVRDVVLVGGEAPDPAWLESFRRGLRGVRVACAIEKALGYFSEQRAQPAALARRVAQALDRALGDANPANGIVWVHNPGLGRNLLATECLVRMCAARELPVLFHHHDWWFDNRWARWPEMQTAGFRAVEQVAHAILPAMPNVRHAAINHADAAQLQRHFGRQAGWLPNLSARGVPPPAARVRAAKRWLAERLGDDAPVWIVPCRLLRRKNLAEALLLTRWLRPGAWLVTTGGASSADEVPYARALDRAAARHGWRLRLGVLAEGEAGHPSVAELMAASEVVLLTSLLEGFGLPNLEASAAGRPLLARRLPNIAPDLKRFGFSFPQVYSEVRIDPSLCDWPAEVQRQSERWRAWRSRLPRSCREEAMRPAWLDGGAPADGVPFSRLTLSAQLEVLAVAPEQSRVACARLNPWLEAWRRRAERGGLQRTPWPRSATKWLGGRAYADRFARLLGAKAVAAGPEAGARAMAEFVRAKLAPENQYPLLWSSAP